MAEAPPPDPYLTLGVSKDAELSQIRTAHRKLALKFHPDRIKDEVEREKGKDEFQKVQAAYELLVDPARRERYDDKIKLAQLRKEAMAREPPPTRYAAYNTRTSPMPPPSSRTEYYNGSYFEERVPRGAESYFDEEYDDRYREPQRTTSRKYDEYEREQRDRKAPSAREAEKVREKKKDRWQAQEGMSFKAAFKMKEAANRAKTRVHEEKSKKDKYADDQRAREQDRRRASADKYKQKIVEDSSSGEETFVSKSRQANRPTKTSTPASPRARAKTESAAMKESRPSSRSYGEEEEAYVDDYEQKHADAFSYINKSTRPSMDRKDSAHSYWDREQPRNSGSDSDRRPHSSRARRPSINVDVPRSRPSMEKHDSAPANLRNMYAEEREPKRSANNVPSSPRNSREMPATINRHNTMPAMNSSRRRENAPRQSSNLKNMEVPHDSGYGSSSSPHTPRNGRHITAEALVSSHCRR